MMHFMRIHNYNRLLIISFILIFFLVISQSNLNLVNASSTYNCQVGEYCVDMPGGNYDVAIDYWTCNSGTCSGKKTWYTYCTFTPEITCTQSANPVNGYYSYQACVDRLKDICLDRTYICKQNAGCNTRTGFCNSPISNRECSTKEDCCYNGYWDCTSWGKECGATDSIEPGTCCRAGSPPCTPSCPTPPCTATCPSGYGLKSSLTIVSEVPACNYTATCTDSDGCGGTKQCNSAACYQIGTCQTNCSLESCNEGEITTPTPTPRPAGCAPRTISCENTTTCGVDNNCADSTRTCYPIGSCQNCTPTTPSGYHIPAEGETTNESLGVECKTSNTCNKTYLCSQGNCGTVTNYFFRNERNTDPSSPTAPLMTIDGVNFNLSTNSSVVTRIKKPLPSTTENTVSFSITGIAINPSVAFGPYYDFIAENKGINNGWLDSTPFDCNGTANEDFCYWRDTSTSKEFHGTSAGHKTPTQILLEGAEGTVAFRSVSTDRCTSANRYSSWTYPSYKVDYLPVVTDVLISGTPSSNRGCSPATISTSSFTGQTVNKTLTITVKGTDADGVGDINGAVIWLVKEGTSIANDINKLTYFNASTPRTDGNKIGIFVRKNNTNSYVANIVSGNLSNWGVGSTVTSISGQQIISSITRNHYSGTGSDLGKYVFEIALTFSNQNAGNNLISGKYNIYAALTDSLSYINYLDQQNVIDSNKDWYFDFINPTFGPINTSVGDAQQRLVDVSFTSSDDQGVLKDTVLNIYISQSPKEVMLINPTSPIGGAIRQTPLTSPISPQPGLINPLSSGWYFDSLQQSFRINIQNNTSGNLSFYPTVYDRACNYTSSNSSSINLNKWIVTKGGILFSSGVISFAAKGIDNDEFWNLGSELIGIATGSHPSKINWDISKNPTSVVNINDRNNSNKESLYEILVDKAKFYKKKYEYPIFTDINECITQCQLTERKVCVCQPISRDITFTDEGTTTYQGKLLILTENNVNIPMDLRAGTPDDALIILTSKAVNIGKPKSGSTTFGTDTIDAFIIAKGGINILSEIESDPGIQQDQVIVNGGLIGLADSGNAINIARNLGLQNLNYPTLIVNYQPRYTKISELFFGTDTRVYKQEVGFKM